MTSLDNCLSSGEKITFLATVIATALAKDLTPVEENIIGNLIMQIGTTLLTIAAIDGANGSAGKNTDSSKDKAKQNS